MDAQGIVIDLSKDGKDGVYHGTINFFGESQAMVMIEDDKLIDVNTRKSYGDIITKKGETNGRAWKLYAIDKFEFKGLAFPVVGFPNGDQDRPGATVLMMELSEKSLNYVKKFKKYQPILETEQPGDKLPF